jgi:hypothetical protein
MMNAVLLAAACVMQLAGGEEAGVKDLLIDFDYRTACGPIACFTSLRYLGERETSLDEVIRLCGWKEGKTSTLLELETALRKVSDVETLAVRLSPEQLTELLADGKYSAILTVRRDSNDINHAFCALRAEEGKILTVDYPALQKWWTTEALVDVWDGRALLVWRKAPPAASQLALQSVIPGMCLGGLVIALCGVVRRARA